jgi:hypothetical protein
MDSGRSAERSRGSGNSNFGIHVDLMSDDIWSSARSSVSSCFANVGDFLGVLRGDVGNALILSPLIAAGEGAASYGSSTIASYYVYGAGAVECALFGSGIGLAVAGSFRRELSHCGVDLWKLLR